MKPAKHLACGGVFQADPTVPPDHRGYGACLGCGLVGQAGDAHHTLPETPRSDARTLAAGDDGGTG